MAHLKHLLVQIYSSFVGLRHALVRFLNTRTLGQLSLALFVVAVLLQLPLVFNPGYFSHDELQWAARANVTSFGDLPWESWIAFDTYQFRPLTFNIWLSMSYFLFEYPFVFHALLVVWGSINALMMLLIARHYRLSTVVIFVGVLVFVMSPYALYVHGWVGTMADLLVMSFFLLLILVALNSSSLLVIAIAAVLLASLALISKESALSIPAVLAVVWLFDGRKTSWMVACLFAGLAAAVYLGLRLPVLLQQPEGTHYTLGVWNAPLRWLEYHLYWIIPNAEEPHTILARGLRSTVVTASLLLFALWLVLWQSHKKIFWAMLCGGVATLAPVLPIASSAGQYGYLFAAWCVMMVSSAWALASKSARVFIAFLVLLSVLHGIGVISMMRHVGKVQAVFSPALAEIVMYHETRQPIRLQMAEESNQWLFKRLTHDIHSYQGVTIEGRVQLVDQDQQAEYLIQPEGQIIQIKERIQQTP